MDGEKLFKTIVSGRDGTILGDAARAGLGALSKVYDTVVAKRNASFDAGKDVKHASVPVISVGNITVGGTGKTPMVRYICDILNKEGYQPAVLSRGYKAKDNKRSMVISKGGELLTTPDISGDEAWLLAKCLPFADVVVGRSRYHSALLATNQLHADCLVLDDGFQHRKLSRAIDVVLIDAANPFGYGYVLPRGLLREPLTELNRADILVLTKTDQVTPEELNDVKDALAGMVPHIPIAETIHKPQMMYTLSEWKTGTSGAAPDAYTEMPVLAVSGIGNPDSFCKTLKGLGYNVKYSLSFGDHHEFTGEDVINMWATAFAHGVKAVVITEKDAVKLSQLKECEDFNMPIYVLRIGIEFTAGEEALIKMIRKLR